MRNPSLTLFTLLKGIALISVFVPANLYAQDHREHFNLYMKVGNADRQLMGSVKTELTCNNHGAPDRQTRNTQILINPGWKWLANRGYVGEHEDKSPNKVEVSWAKSPSRFYRNDSRYGTSFIEFTTETHNAGAISFDLRYSGNHHLGIDGGDYFYTYIMWEEGYSQPYSNDEPNVASQVESPEDLDEGYDSLQSLKDLGATALDPYSVTVTSARLGIINLYHQSDNYEALGSWYFNNYFNDNNPDSHSGMGFDFGVDLGQIQGFTPAFNQELNQILDFSPDLNLELDSGFPEERGQQANEQNHQPAAEARDQPSFEHPKNVFFDIWSLFENRMLVHRLIADSRYSIFLVSPHLGTNPVMLSNSWSTQQEGSSTFNLLSALQDPLGGRPVVGSIHLVGSSSATLDRVRMEFTTNTNKNVQIDLERAPGSEALTEIPPLPTPEQAGRDISATNGLANAGILEGASPGFPEPEWFQNLGAHLLPQFLNGNQ